MSPHICTNGLTSFLATSSAVRQAKAQRRKVKRYSFDSIGASPLIAKEQTNKQAHA
jgi:hypothetical protein